tara:strand:+ start:303 stop:611 length:309 start_codon:yes stop_codon:yes gene_type:complete
MGETVFLDSTDEPDPYIALIEEIWVENPVEVENAVCEPYLTVRWFYRWSDVAPGEPDRSPFEIFWSFHVDENPAVCILRRCPVEAVVGPSDIQDLINRKVWN